MNAEHPDRKASMRVVAVILFLLFGVGQAASAQNNITTQQIGNFVYFGGSLNGEAVGGTAQRIGDMLYYNLTIGGRSVSFTKQIIGSQTYTHGQDGSTTMSQRIGSQTYTTAPGGITYTTQRIGNFIYTHGSTVA